MIGIGIGVPLQNYRGSLSAEALAWEARIIANGGTIPAATLAIFDQYFFRPAVLNGNILGLNGATELDRLNVYCGLVGYEIAARTNLIKSAHYVSPVSSPTFDNNGYKTSGTSYLNLNYIPSTQGVKNTLNSNCWGYVCMAPNYASLKRAMGSGKAGQRSDLLRETTPRQSAFNYATAGILNTNTTTIGNVFFATRRQSSLNADSIINTSIVNTSSASLAISDVTQYELTANSGTGTPDGNYDDKYHLCSWHGSGNLDYLNLRLILINLFTALGV